MQHLARSKDLEKLVPQGVLDAGMRSCDRPADAPNLLHATIGPPEMQVASTEADEVVPALRSEGRCVDQALRPGGVGKFQAS